MSDPAKWYVINTYSGYENKVLQGIEKSIKNRQLQDIIHEVKIPTKVVSEIKDGKTRKFSRKLFPGYVMVKMILTDDSWYIIKKIRGVTGFIGSASKPIPLSQKEIEYLGVENNEIEVDYKMGDSVQIISGSLEGFCGSVASVNKDSGTATITVSILGRNTPVEIKLNQATLKK